MPGQKFYTETVISTEEGEQWFCSESDARAAGWRKSKRLVGYAKDVGDRCPNCELPRHSGLTSPRIEAAKVGRQRPDLSRSDLGPTKA
ncbi:hypothetical protein DTW90_34875 [Neorhizobium sp. P12A]|nr:hypothetical protein DTW90_34875 [Neorhizobium sp. P12A]